MIDTQLRLPDLESKPRLRGLTMIIDPGLFTGQYADRITLNFFGDQVVCHLSDHVDAAPQLYPRHFGVTFRDRQDWRRLLSVAKAHGLPFFAEQFRRFDGRPEGHDTFVLRDPSNNLLEFKYYDNPAMVY